MHAIPQTETFLHPHNNVPDAKISITDTSLFTGVQVLKVTVIRFIFFNLMQISYLVGVGLLLNFELLACVHSQGMLYHNSVIF